MATPFKHLITFADVTSRTVMQLGSDAHKINVAIPEAEEEHLRPVLGDVLFSDLLNFVQTATPDDADPLAELAEQVKDMVAAWTLVEAWPSLLVHIEASGVNTKVGKSEGTTTADVALTDRTLSNLHEKALRKSRAFTRWLTKHAADYPAWQVPGGQPSTEMPLGGLFL
jgi:hypothetical protein